MNLGGIMLMALILGLCVYGVVICRLARRSPDRRQSSDPNERER